jgi:hypothetical protein
MDSSGGGRTAMRAAFRHQEDILLRGASATVRLALGFCASALFLAVPAPAFAQVLDPVSVLEEPVKEVERAAEETVEETEATVEETSETVNKVIEDTSHETEKVVFQLHDKVDEVVDVVIDGPDQPTTEPPSGDVTSPTPPGPGPDQGKDRTTSRGPRDDVRSAFAERAAGGGHRERASLQTFRTNRVTVAAAPVSDAIPDGEPFAASPPVTPGEAAQRLVFPMFMIVAVVAFLLLQGRFDRLDPKLLFDFDVESESLSFE